MAGEVVERCDLTESGLSGDRLYAFASSGAPPGMLRLTSRERREMLRYQPRHRPDGRVEVEVPTGERFLVDSPDMLAYLSAHLPDANKITLTRASTPQTDVRPLSLISVQTIRQLTTEMGQEIDPRRFRANLYIDFPDTAFGEDSLVGRTVSIGPTATIYIRERDPRCRFITYDPKDPGQDPLFSLMKLLDRSHQGRAGVYATIEHPGPIQAGRCDPPRRVVSPCPQKRPSQTFPSVTTLIRPQPSPCCHPERSRGTCSSTFRGNTNPHRATSQTFPLVTTSR